MKNETQKLTSWTHPKTGEIRIYCNCGQNAKVWLQRDDTCPVGPNYSVECKARSQYDFPHQFKNGSSSFIDMAESVFAAALGCDIYESTKNYPETFEDLVKFVAEKRSESWLEHHANESK